MRFYSLSNNKQVKDNHIDRFHKNFLKGLYFYQKMMYNKYYETKRNEKIHKANKEN